jgi:DNA-binding NtrC family response regulator
MSTECRNRRAVLVIEDDPMVRDLLSSALRRAGLDVLLAAAGEEGVALFQENREAVVLLDVRRPGLHGTAVLAALRALSPAVRACVMTADCDPEELAKLKGLGALQVFSKPFRLAAMVEAVSLLAAG